MKTALAGNLEGTAHSFARAGREIRVDSFPGTAKETPSIVLLHGANGIRATNTVVSGIIQFLAVHDFHVHLVHYFDRSGTDYADDPTIHQWFGEWRETVGDAVRHIRQKYPGKRLGMFGHSLGGFLTAAEMIRNAEVDAAVVLSGGLDAESARHVERTPPALVLHGSSDTRVPLGEARRLEAALTAAGRAPEMHVYPGEGHYLEMASYADAIQRALHFLNLHLR